MVFENEMIPPLQAEYTDSPDEPTRPASDEMFTIRPRPRAVIPWSTA